jgi:heme/copper-type cytochrome/quinol oxidase subunit 2
MTWYHSGCDWHSTDDEAQESEPWGLVKAIAVLSAVTFVVLVLVVVVVICVAVRGCA